MLRRIAVMVAAAVTAAGLLGAGQAAQVRTAGPARHVKVVHLHRAYERALGQVRPGRISGIVRPRGTGAALPRRSRAAARPNPVTACQEPNCPVSRGTGPVQDNPRVYLLP